MRATRPLALLAIGISAIAYVTFDERALDGLFQAFSRFLLPSEDPPSRPNTTLHGRVTTGKGEPIEAKVFLRNTGPNFMQTLRQTRSGPTGEYVFEGVEPGDWKVQAVASGFAKRAVAVKKTTEGPDAVDILLDEGARIEGRIVDADGTPAAGWPISATPYGADLSMEEIWDRTPHDDTTSRQDGSFTMGGLVEGEYALALYRGTLIYSDGVIARTEDRNATLRVRSIGELQGRVRFVDGKAPDTFTVAILGSPRQTFADRSGRFLLRVPVLALVPLEVAAPGFVTALVSARVPESGHRSVEVTLRTSKTVRGRVAREIDGAPIAGAVVAVLPRRRASEEAWYGSPEAQTDADGRFAVEGVAHREVAVSVFASGYGTVHAKASTARSVDLRLSAGTMVFGNLVFAGSPLFNAELSLRPADLSPALVDEFWVERSGRTAPGGFFVFHGVRPGSYTMVVSSASELREIRYQRSIPLVVTSTPNSGLDLDLADGTRTLSIVLPRASAEGWIVVVEDASRTRSYSRIGLSGERISFDRLPAGDYTVELADRQTARRAQERGDEPTVAHRRAITVLDVDAATEVSF